MLYSWPYSCRSAVVGSLSLFRKPLLCRWSFMPANTIVIGCISVCRCTPIAIETDCIRSRSTAANILTSGQNRDLEVNTKCARDYHNLCLPHFCFVIRSKDGLIFLDRLQVTVSLNITFLIHLFRVRSFFYLTWGSFYLP